MRPSVIFGLALLNTVAQAKYEIDASCKGHVNLIKEELGQAQKMDLAGKNLLESKGKTYYEKFMSAKAQEKIVAITESPASEGIKKVFQNSADLMNEKDGDTVVKITCDDTTTDCQDKTKDVQAHVIQSSGTINLCKSLLSDSDKVSELQQDCDVLNMNDIATRSFAFAVVHELKHFKEVMKPILGKMPDSNFQKCADLAYGPDDCLDLAAGKLKQNSKRSESPPSTQKMCSALKNAASTKSKSSKTTKKTSRAEAGCFDEEFTMLNADSYALIAGGAYFTELCKQEIPLEEPASSSSSSSSGSSKAGSSKAGSSKAGSPSA